MSKMGFLDHLDELRRRLIYCVIFVVIAAFACYAFVEPLFEYLRHPLAHAAGHKLIVLEPLEIFVTYIKLSLLAALFISMPWMLLQLWLFIAPGLYPRERRWILPFVVLGSLFFVGGAAFAFYLVLPVAFEYLVKMAPASVESHFSVAAYFSLLINMMLAFGVIFELPLVMWVLCAAGIVAPQSFAKMRKYWIVIATILGGVLTPTPDPLSQILMAGPLIVFFELGILGGKLLYRKKAGVSL